MNVVLAGIQDARPVEDVESKFRMSEAEGNEVAAIVLFFKADSRIFGKLLSLVFLRLRGYFERHYAFGNLSSSDLSAIHQSAG